MRILLAAVLVSTCLVTTARADVPPEPGYVEQCTVEVEQRDGRSCTACSGAYHGDTEACSKVWEPKGYALACKTRGASVWGEVYCKADPGFKAPAVAPAAQQSKKGCAIGLEGPAGVLTVLSVLGAVWFARRRRA
jgi:hypothetical protein